MSAELFNRFQGIGRFHPLTCGNCRDTKLDQRGFPSKEFHLVAHDEDPNVVLTCPEDDCDWRQVLGPESELRELIESLMTHA